MPHPALGVIVALSILGIVLRPFRWPEAVWAVAGAAALLVFGLLSPTQALAGILKGLDLYLFLFGMMLLAEVARREGLFDWLATHAVRHAKGSPHRLFLLVYLVGTLVTAILSNDATAVVLTPAVYAAARAAKAEPLPYLFACALIANAASFLLPISNPANLVVFADHLPALVPWIGRFGPPSLAAIVLTYGALRWTQRKALRQPIAASVEGPPLSHNGKLAALGLLLAAVVLVTASATGTQLGWPTAAAGLATTVAILALKRESPGEMVTAIAWSVFPLVAGLFILVEALQDAGAVMALARPLKTLAAQSPLVAGWASGLVTGLTTNLVNNLPAGLLAGAVTQTAHLADRTTGAILVGIDLGPNLSVTGSLATLLWLAAIRREGENVSAWAFLRVGAVAMPLALVGALAALLWLG